MGVLIALFEVCKDRNEDDITLASSNCRDLVRKPLMGCAPAQPGLLAVPF
jgi:hypothetical protein